MIILYRAAASSSHAPTAPPPCVRRPRDGDAIRPPALQQRFMLSTLRPGFCLGTGRRCDCFQQVSSLPPLIHNAIVKTLSDEYTVGDAEVHADRDDHGHEPGPQRPREIADVAHEPDENECETDCFGRRVAVVFDELRDEQEDPAHERHGPKDPREGFASGQRNVGARS